MSRLQYRGVSYDSSRHEQPAEQPVDHAYRGQHYSASLRHEPTESDPAVELHYRGLAYHHDRAAAATHNTHS